MLFIGNKRSLLWSGLSLTGKIRKLFAAGQPGAWYDFSQFGREYQDSVGTTPVTAIEQPLGLVLDGKTDYAIGAELLINNSFDAGGTGWTNPDTAPSVTTFIGGNAVMTAAPGSTLARLRQALTVTAGYYIVTVDVASTTGSTVGCSVAVGNSTSGDATYAAISTATGGVRSGIYYISGPTLGLAATAGSAAGGVVTLNSISVKRIQGNHLTQATAAARPVVSSRVNLLVSSEAFTPTWSKSLTVLGVGAGTSPKGGLADLIIPQAIAGAHNLQQARSVVSGATYTTSIYAKAGGYSSIQLNYAGYAEANFDLVTGVVSSVAASNAAFINYSASIEPAEDGWFLCTVTRTCIANVAGSVRIYINNSASYSTLGIDNFTGDGVGGVYLWGAQLEYGAYTKYQLVKTATDYDTAGFPSYAKFDGVDDFISSPSGGGATTGFFWCGVLQVLGGAGSNRTIFSDRVGNAGYILRMSTVNQPNLYVGDGAQLLILANTTTPTVGEKFLLTAWDDGVNLNLQVNSGAIAQMTRPSIAVGGAAISLGGSGGVFFNGNIYSETYRTGTPLTAAERAAAQAWCKAEAGL